MNNKVIINLYFFNEFIPNYISNCRDIFYILNKDKYIIKSWNDIYLYNYHNIIIDNYKYFNFYTRYMINNEIDIEYILNTHFRIELEEYISNCSDNIYLYQKCKELICNINEILLFIEFNQSSIHLHIDYDLLNVELINLENITDHLLYIFAVSDFLLFVIQNYLYEYYLFNLQSDIIGNNMFQIPILNQYNIQSRNELVKEPLTNDFLYNMNNKILKKSNLFLIYKSNSRKIIIILNQCIDYLYTKDIELPNSFKLELQNLSFNNQPKTEVINTKHQMTTITNRTQTPIKKTEVLGTLLSIKNRLSTPRKDIRKSPYQKIFEMSDNEINISYYQTNSLRRRLESVY